MRKLFLTFLIASFCLSITSLAWAQQKGGLSSVKDGEKDVKAPPATVKANLDCSGAIPVMLDAVYTGDTTGGVNTVTTYGCSSFDESGPEVVYVITFTEPTMFHVDLTPEAGVDLDLAAVENCDEDLGCLVVADTGIVTNSPVTGTFYFVVDGYNGAAGSYTLEFFQDPIPQPISACAEVIQPLPGNEGDVVPAGVYNFSGDTCPSTNHVEFLACADYSEAGADNFYEFTLLPGASIDVTVTNTADGALWILDGCAEPFSCLAYADATFTGDPETISYSNPGATNKTVFLVVDSYGAASCGTYSGSVTVNVGAVGAEFTNWSSLKSRF